MTVIPYARLVDLADAVLPEPSDLEIVTAVSEAFDMSLAAAIQRLRSVNLVAVRRQVSP